MIIITLNYDWQKIPSMIIFAGAYHLRKYFENNIDGDIFFAWSPTGFSNNQLGLAYIQHFDQFTKDSRKEKYQILLFNNYGLHITQEFVNYYW